MHLGSNPQITHSFQSNQSSLSKGVFYKDTEDWVIFAGSREERDLVKPIEEIEAHIDALLADGHKIAYITGGFEGTMAHIQLLGQFSNPVVLGLEPDKYILNKGRLPLNTLDQRIDFWSKLLPEGSIIFVVPDHSEDGFYDSLAKEIGVFRRQNVYHIGCNDDREDVKIARRSRAASGYYLEVSFGENLHASNYN
ncbi:hypothetical protein HYV12_04370 [Candidatus Dojkabacteria bacterium]|nr:hypothetical protein [Candidatus Dojkabacteria bacterium]